MTIDRDSFKKADKKISPENVSATLGKGEVIDAQKLLADGTIVTDTGAHADFLKTYKDKNEFSPADIDEIYKTTIKQGVIDHHSIDSFFSTKGVKVKKCSTQMVVDYPEAVLNAINEYKISKVATHADGDMDSITSAYLVKSLIENGKLPKIAKELAAICNQFDYGEFQLQGDAFTKSLPGILSAIKSSLSGRCQAELAKEVFGNPACKSPEGRLNQEGVALMTQIRNKYEDQVSQIIYQIYNSIEELHIQNDKFEIGGDCTEVIKNLTSSELNEMITNGQLALKKNLEEFDAKFADANKTRAIIDTKDGQPIEVPMVISADEKPLYFTNNAYMRTSPDSIIAVYGGKDRKTNDMYDIGITPDSANLLDLSSLCLALNRAEKAKRDEIYAKPKTERTAEEQKLIAAWDGQGDREAFFGLFDRVKRGEIPETDIVRKDPTVLVAGGSLIAASRTSLLTEEDFRKVLEQFTSKKT